MEDYGAVAPVKAGKGGDGKAWSVWVTLLVLFAAFAAVLGLAAHSLQQQVGEFPMIEMCICSFDPVRMSSV
jgi:hypothetical protein